MEKERKKRKKKTFGLLLSICGLSLVISVICLIISVFSLVRLKNIEDSLGLDHGISYTLRPNEETYTEDEMKEKLEYKTIDVEGIQVTYPCSGTIGEKGFYRSEYDTNEYFLDIESFEFTEKSLMQAYGGSKISYNIEFVGTDYWDYEPQVKLKEYDEEGFFIAEKSGYLEHGGRGEHVKLTGLVELDGNAKKVIVELIP